MQCQGTTVRGTAANPARRALRMDESRCSCHESGRPARGDQDANCVADENPDGSSDIPAHSGTRVRSCVGPHSFYASASSARSIGVNHVVGTRLPGSLGRYRTNGAGRGCSAGRHPNCQAAKCKTGAALLSHWPRQARSGRARKDPRRPEAPTSRPSVQPA